MGKRKVRLDGKKVDAAKASTLALFQARIFLVDDINTALPANHLAVRSAAFDGSANSHIFTRKKNRTKIEKGMSSAPDAKTKTPPRHQAQGSEAIKGRPHGKLLVHLFSKRFQTP
jgi:hypothetical protein